MDAVACEIRLYGYTFMIPIRPGLSSGIDHIEADPDRAAQFDNGGGDTPHIMVVYKDFTRLRVQAERPH